MADDITITSNAKSVEQLFKIYPKEMAKRTVPMLTKYGNIFLNLFRRRRLTGGTTPTRLAVRTGALRRSFGKVVLGSTYRDLRLIVYTSSPYAKVHEGQGGGRKLLIRAKPGKALAIPLDAATTAAGVARWPSPRSPGAPPMHIIQLLRGKGHALLVNSISGEPLFLLVKSVRIPPRLGLEDEMEGFMPVMVDALGNLAVNVWNDTSLVGGRLV